MIINLTPHPIVFLDADNKVVLSIESTFPNARCEEEFIYYGEYVEIAGQKCNVEFGEVSYSRVKDLPAEEEGTFYIVSVLVAQQFPERHDLYIPYDLVRKDGRIIGCRKLARVV